MAFTIQGIDVDVEVGDTLSATVASPSQDERYVHSDDTVSDTTVPSILQSAPVLASLYSPGEFCVDYDNFTDYSTSNYTETLNSGSVALSTTTPGGILVITSDTAATETNTQKKVVWNPHTTKTLYGEVRFMVTDAAGGEVFLGLVDEITTPIDDGPTDGVWIEKPSASSQLQVRSMFSSDHSGGTVTPVIVTSGTWHRLAFVLSRTRIFLYFDGVQLYQNSAFFSGTPKDVNDLRWIFGTKGTGSAATVLSVDYHVTIQAR